MLRQPFFFVGRRYREIELQKPTMLAVHLGCNRTSNFSTAHNHNLPHPLCTIFTILVVPKCVVQLHQVLLKLDEKQKSFINSPFFCSEFQSVSRIVKIVHSAMGNHLKNCKCELRKPNFSRKQNENRSEKPGNGNSGSFLGFGPKIANVT